MSGIVGLLNLDGRPADTELLARLTQLMAARGPDAQATWAEGAIGLGHSLLGTTFESAQEAQPCSLDGAVWITADARIDGRAELIAELRARGRAADARRPDVELILHAYAAWDTACVEHLLGDFAFAIWDGRRQRLFCARDQLGVTPFFYSLAKQTLAFSNSLDCLRRLPGFSPALDELAVADFLLFRSNQDPTTTIFAGIRRLALAHTLTCADGTLRTARYWRLPEKAEIEFRPADETVTRFQNLFAQAVGDRLRTERVAVSMSGGMDSSSVAVVAQQLLAEAGLLAGTEAGIERGIRAFTVTRDTSNPDYEGRHAGLVAEHAHLPIEYLLPVDGDPYDIDNLPAPGPEPGTPGPDSVELRLWRRMAGYSRVSLSGMGADPLLYPSRTFAFDLFRRGHWLRLAQSLAQHLKRNGSLPPLYIRSELKRRFDRTRPLPPPNWINPTFAARLELRQRWHDVRASLEALDQRRSMAETPYWSNLMAIGDPGYCGLLLESRHPFFDVRLLTFMLTVPPIPWLVNKALLRDAMRGRLPESIRLRPKTPLASRPAPAETASTPEWPLRLAASPELEPYVNSRALIQMIRAPAQAAIQDQVTLGPPLALAYWLRAQSSRFGNLDQSDIMPAIQGSH